MEPKPFLERLEARHPGAITKLSNYDLTWSQWAKFTKITSSLDYGCNFKTEAKGEETCSSGKHESCCCGQCGPDVGYLDRIPSNKKTLKEISSLFGVKYGFWRKKKGCILPAKYRSTTCINFRCSNALAHRNSILAKYPWGTEFLQQMILYFLDASRTDRLNTTQKRIIIKELIKCNNI